MSIKKTLLLPIFILTSITIARSQSVTGVWRGKINGTPTELKLVKSGDQLVGVAYYYQNKKKYKRYSIKGHFDPETNSVIWWDELLLNDISAKKTLQIGPDQYAQMTVADFNCPGSDDMFLDGNSSSRDNKQQQNGIVHLEKIDSPIFPDEWDYIINNYYVGTNNPQLIDSISQYGLVSKIPEETLPEPIISIPGQAGDVPPVIVISPQIPTYATQDKIEAKFSSRKNVLQTVIPIAAKTIELRFYDNAEVDGDSIAVFLNGKLLHKNIRLTDQPYTILIHADDLSADNELVMVAENLGSIPPNTSYMVAIVGDKRYEARLYANEQTSALIRIIQP
ncbi:hypothetical protein [Flavihumibacter fluvii]|uniref:hypothetical protein n=1 Tax=Flavihumibacter fluvii TaxID=2838157 RepID=UPI001BDEAC83|nr:hypothetical protein [Flavihumibacter fluvii]ULQ52536.1 hypothetical protein KJS93_20820 [Flavihumibacter fluvii]